MIRAVYILTSDFSGYYPEQCLMSLYTLRKHNPDTSTLVVTDTQTRECLNGSRLDALAHYAEVISFDTPPEYNTVKLRSRFLKTSLRKLVPGDFLFLDCDTLVCRSFSFEEFKDADIGMVADLNAALPLSNEYTVSKCKGAGFPNLKGSPYFNSGVIFVKDAPLAFKFYETWHQLWRESVQNGCTSDQPALCEANRRLGGIVDEIPGSWNCQIQFSESLRYLHHASVLHYFAGDGVSQHSFHEEALLKHIQNNGIDSVVDSVLSGSIEALTAFFRQKSASLLRYLGSDMFSIYTEDPAVFRFVERLSTILRQLKRTGSKIFSGK